MKSNKPLAKLLAGVTCPGRHAPWNPDERTVVQNVVERIGIRLEWVFRDGFGVKDAEGRAHPMSRQVSNAVYDIERILNYNTCTTFFRSEAPPPPQGQDVVIVNDVTLMEWGFNSMFRGTPNEVLIGLLQFTISYPKNIG